MFACINFVFACFNNFLLITERKVHRGQKSTIVFYKYLVINQYRIFISQQSADKVIKGSKLADFYFFDNIMLFTSYNSNIIALQGQFPIISRLCYGKDAECDA